MSKIKLKEIGSFKNGLNFSADHVSTGCKMIGIPDFGERYFAEFENLAEIDDSIVPDNYTLMDGDILFVRSNGNKALVGRTMLIKEIKEKITFSGFCIRFRPNKDVALPMYLLLVFKSPIFRKRFSTTQQTSINNINQEVLSNFEIELPPLNEQQRIVECMYPIIQKMAINEAINDNLAQQLRLLYDYWFTQFDFPDENGKPYRSSGGQMVWNDDLKRHIPNFWGCDNLYRIADYVNGLACQKHRPVNGEEALPVIKIKEMHDGITADTELVSANIPSKNIVQPGDILFSWSASLEIAFWFGCTAGLNQHIFKVIPKAPFSREYVYLQLSEYIVQFVRIAESRKTTMGHITSDHLNESRVVIPPIEVIQKFTTIARPIFEELKVCHAEMEHLQNLRDWLLPMLMNGQATISD